MEATDAAALREKGPPTRRRLLRIAIWVGGVALAIFALNLLGIPVSEWIRDLLKKIREVPPWAVVSGVILQTVQIVLAALAWLGILRAAFPREPIRYRMVLACYATAVALNGFLPANIGTFVMLAMFSTLIASATFAAVFSGLVVQKIPFSVFNLTLYMYLFLSVAGSFSIKLGFLADHTGLVALILGGAVVLLVILARIFWRRAEKLRAQLVTGGAILRSPRDAPGQGCAARARQLPGPTRGDRRLPRRLRDPGDLPQRRHRDRLKLDLKLDLGHPRWGRRQPGDEHRGAEEGHRREQRDGLLGGPAADHHRLERDLRGDHGLLGVRVVRRAGAGRVLLWRCEGTQPGDERGTQEAQAREAAAGPAGASMAELRAAPSAGSGGA